MQLWMQAESSSIYSVVPSFSVRSKIYCINYFSNFHIFVVGGKYAMSPLQWRHRWNLKIELATRVPCMYRIYLNSIFLITKIIKFIKFLSCSFQFTIKVCTNKIDSTSLIKASTSLASPPKASHEVFRWSHFFFQNLFFVGKKEFGM